MSDETLILDRDAFADERVRGDLATFTNARVLLYLDERADLRVRSDRTTVEVYKIRLKDANPGTDDYVSCYRHVLLTALRLEQTRQGVKHPGLGPAHVGFANRVEPPALIVEEASLVTQILNCPASNIVSQG